LLVPAQFRIYARTKAKAKQYAKAVADAFDNDRLTMQNDLHIQTFRGTDFSVREGDRNWSWIVNYNFRIEATYDTDFA
jgi:hypothetical protein